MKTNRLSKNINAALNKQITKEAQASQTYLSFSSWASQEGYDGISKFLFGHAQEERAHMLKIFDYVLTRGGKAEISAIPAPTKNPTSIQDCFNKVFEQEVDNTNSIYKIVKLSMEEEDWATWNFAQWFVKEQIEEETLSMSLLDRIKIAGGEKAANEALLELDKEIKAMNSTNHPA